MDGHGQRWMWCKMTDHSVLEGGLQTARGGYDGGIVGAAHNDQSNGSLEGKWVGKSSFPIGCYGLIHGLSH